MDQLNDPNMSGGEYLQAALGDKLAKALAAVAKARPLDPLQFVADFLSAEQEKEDEEESEKKSSDDEDSGLYEDQEAPSNNDDSMSTLELSEKKATAKEKKSSFAHKNEHFTRHDRSIVNEDAASLFLPKERAKTRHRCKKSDVKSPRDRHCDSRPEKPAAPHNASSRALRRQQVP